MIKERETANDWSSCQNQVGGEVGPEIRQGLTIKSGTARLASSRVEAGLHETGKTTAV